MEEMVYCESNLGVEICQEKWNKLTVNSASEQCHNHSDAVIYPFTLFSVLKIGV